MKAHSDKRRFVFDRIRKRIVSAESAKGSQRVLSIADHLRQYLNYDAPKAASDALSCYAYQWDPPT
jgi:hypothetical protein